MKERKWKPTLSTTHCLGTLRCSGFSPPYDVLPPRHTEQASDPPILPTSPNTGTHPRLLLGKHSWQKLNRKKKKLPVSWILKICTWFPRFTAGSGILAGSASLQMTFETVSSFLQALRVAQMHQLSGQRASKGRVLLAFLMSAWGDVPQFFFGLNFDSVTHKCVIIYLAPTTFPACITTGCKRSPL